MKSIRPKLKHFWDKAKRQAAIQRLPESDERGITMLHRNKGAGWKSSRLFRGTLVFKKFSVPAYATIPAYTLQGGGNIVAQAKPNSVVFQGVTPAVKPNPAVRALDIVVAAAALLFLLPLMIAIALAIRASGPGGSLFRQRRVGYAGNHFTCLKFRTMHVNSDHLLFAMLERDADARAEWEKDQKLRRDPRVLSIGRILRKTSLDELPQLINVLLGSMSIVGPRPIVPTETWRYGRYFGEYCRVRPGITGLWQVSGRNHTTYRRRVACDVAYVRRKSAVNDVRIIFKTIPVVLLARGAY